MAACFPVKSYLFRLLVKKSLLLKMQQLILGTGTAIWWLTEPHSWVTQESTQVKQPTVVVLGLASK
jgi:hypothetical protein